MRNWKLRGKELVKSKPEVRRDPLEKDVQATILAYLKLKGIESSVTNADRTWGKGGGVRKSKVDKGHPDITAVLPVYLTDASSNRVKVGLSLYIEVKTATGTVKPEQKETLQRLSDAGALCLVARDVKDVVWIVDKFKDRGWTSKASDSVNRILAINLYERRTKSNRELIEQIKLEIDPSTKSQSE